MLSIDYFLAKISTVKKGQYYGRQIIEMFFGCQSEQKHQEIKPFLFGLSAIMPDHFHYSDTHNLDILTIK